MKISVPNLFQTNLQIIQVQGVQTLSVQSNLQISPLQNWPNFNNLGSNLPQDHCNLHSIVDSCENSNISL